MLSLQYVCKRCKLNTKTVQAVLACANSTKPAIKLEEDYEKQLKEFECISSVVPKVRTKKPQRPPFVKNLFLGKFDTDILAYPELNKADQDALQKNVSEISIDDSSCKSLKDYLKVLNNSRLLGLQAPQLIEGRELAASESCRLTQLISEHKYRNNIISNEYLSIQALLKFGNDVQQKKYLKQFMNGDMVAGFCLSELPATATMAVCSGGTSWILNGEKNWVINGAVADALIVIAETGRERNQVTEDILVTAFLIDKNTPGVEITKCNVDSTDEVAHIKFNNVKISADDALGSINGGKQVLESLIPEFRLNFATTCIATTTNLLNKLIEYCINNSVGNMKLYEADAARFLTGRIAASVYAMESMTFLTTGLLDGYENQDCELEAAIVKAFSIGSAHKSTVDCLKFLGPQAMTEDHWCLNLHKQALSMLTAHEADNSLKLTIALLGLQHAGTQLDSTVRKRRNPLFHSAYILKRIFLDRRQYNDDPKLDLGVAFNLHPSCLGPANNLEYCVLRLQYATEIILSREGAEIVNEHTDLRRLGECAMDIYAMTACLARASRSYCIGLQHADTEMILAEVFCNEAKRRVQRKVNMILEGRLTTGQENYKHISKRLFKFKEYVIPHPLSRNY